MYLPRKDGDFQWKTCVYQRLDHPKSYESSSSFPCPTLKSKDLDGKYPAQISSEVLGGDQSTGLVGPRVELHISWMETDEKGIVPWLVERDNIQIFSLLVSRRGSDILDR